MVISNLLGLKNMILLALVAFVFLETPATATRKEASPVAKVPSGPDSVQWAGYGEENLSSVVISGKLLCHTTLRNDKLSGNPRPVTGATVLVMCGTGGIRKRSWAKGSTNSYGEFIIDLPSHLHVIPNLEKICHVEVVHVPKSYLGGRAFTGKQKGITLTSIGEGLRIYTTSNIHLMPKSSYEHVRREGKTETYSIRLVIAWSLSGGLHRVWMVP